MADRREFQLRDGKSNKFWAVTLDDTEQTVQFGRVGTAGQTQTKTFPSAEAARAATDKLIAEKLKKGYAEVGGGTAESPPPPAAAKKARTKKAVAQEPAATTAAEAPRAEEPLAVTRRIDLDDRDWLWATWRPRRPLAPRPAPAPFDRDACVARLKGLQAWLRGHYDPAGLGLRFPMTPQEAHFWAEFFTAGGRALSPGDIATRLEGQTFDGSLRAEDLADRVAALGQHLTYQAFLLPKVLCSLWQPAAYVRFALRPEVAGHVYLTGLVVDAFQDEVWPYLEDAQIEPLRELLRPAVTPQGWPAGTTQRPAPAYYLAALLGLHDELLALVRGWPDDAYTAGKRFEYWDLPQRIVLGLGDARLAGDHMRRLGLGLPKPQLLRAWLAHTEYSGLDLVRDTVLRASSKADAEVLFKVFRLVHAPEAAPHVLELKLSSKVPALARQWLDDEPANAVAGLLPAAAGTGKLAEAARDFLREACHRGRRAFLEEQLKQVSPEVAGKVRQEVLAEADRPASPAFDETTTPAWLRAALAAGKGKHSPLPRWIGMTALPHLTVGGHRLYDAQMMEVIGDLRQRTSADPGPVVAALKQHVAQPVLDAFAWKLFELWLGEGGPPKEKWAMLAVGLLGGDACALRLAPLVRSWPGEGQHPRAVLGLECLRAIGTDTALTQLGGIAQKVSFQGIKKKAQAFMEAIAADRGLSRAELEDRIVPDLGLDERGSRVFDFGPRQFRVVLSPDLAPQVRDAEGKARADLPKPGAKDDPEKATAAVAGWKLLKKQLREALKVQAPRLEQAMVTGRRWTPEQFETLLVRHPLMTHLAQRLVWGTYDAGGRPVGTFRVTDDHTYADAEDRPWTPAGVASVAIVHPLHLGDEQRQAWGAVMGDYELVPPFAQLGRPLHHATPQELAGKQLARLDGRKVPSLALRGTLERLGWTRGSPANHGMLMEFVKPFPGPAVTAVLENEPGIPMGIPDWTEDQSVKRVFFLPGTYRPLDYPYHKEEGMVPLGQVEAVALSEVLGDLTELASKGK
jgi:predicted DNA-binding WGR domain protein